MDESERKVRQDMKRARSTLQIHYVDVGRWHFPVASVGCLVMFKAQKDY